MEPKEYICPHGHRFTARYVKRGRIYCPKCYIDYSQKHLESILKKRGGV
jgi:hypothetical protein